LDLKLEYAPGATPLDPNEREGLIPSYITLQSQLNEFEEANILEARNWAYARRRGDPLEREFIRTVHRRMFDKTWRWAGDFRRSEKNVGGAWTDIPVRLFQLTEDVRAQVQYKAYPHAEIAARFHHRLVSIHPFPNGNGRHSRFMADLLLKDLTGEVFTWGHGTLTDAGELRDRYIDSLRDADRGDYSALFRFLDISEAPPGSLTP
jgi:Fic-DOC domain mobile mystery protein B